MALITVLPHPDLCPEGKSFELRKGKSLCEGLLAAGIALEHACEMVTACATSRGVKTVYSDDADIAACAKAVGIRVVRQADLLDPPNAAQPRLI